MITERSIEIDRPIEQVFEFTTTRVEEWSLIVVKDEVVDDKHGKVGTRFRTTTEDRGKEMVFEGVVTRHDPPKAHSVVMEGKQFDIEVDYTFRDLGGRTKVTQRSTVTGKGFTKLMFVLCGGMMTKASCESLDKELQNLKRLIEAQDGSSST